MKKYCENSPLSSDALSGFGRLTLEQDKKEISAATATLFKTVIPNVAFQLNALSYEMTIPSFINAKQLHHEAHRNG